MKKHHSYLSLLKATKLKALLSFGVKGYLAEIGWFKAFETKSAIDEEGEPIPWVTYSFIDFIKNRITKQHSIFEFGSGNSTLFYTNYARKVVAVEHDKDWFEKIFSSKSDNSEIIFCELKKNGEYSRKPLMLNQKFDIIIVDGRDRVNCCKNSLEALAEGGVLVLDDSEREKYSEALDFLRENGFRHLSFSGISPGLFYRKSTSVFYKEGNCLAI